MVLIHRTALRAAEIAQGESHFAAQGIIGWHFAGQQIRNRSHPAIADTLLADGVAGSTAVEQWPSEQPLQNMESLESTPALPVVSSVRYRRVSGINLQCVYLKQSKQNNCWLDGCEKIEDLGGDSIT